MIGQTIGPYEVQALLGEGAMGEVYRARDSRLGRSVALKVLHQRVSNARDARRRFLREARSLAAVHHPGIATLFGFESIEGHDLLVMELVEGQPLSALVHEGGIGAEKARDLLTQICEALSVAHDQGIVHRDLKPANLMLTPEGKVKILDFGLAIGDDDTMITLQGARVGTIAYMSPEQARGESLDVRSDLFSLGVIAYELLTGERPFRAEKAASVLHSIADLQQAPHLPNEQEAPTDLATFVERCLQPVAASRAASAHELLSLIAPEVDAKAKTEPQPATRVPRSRVLLLVALAVIAAGVIFVAKALVPPAEREPSPTVTNTSLQRASIAVLPFSNLTPDQDLGWFGIAVSDLLAGSLTNSGLEHVISPERVRLILDPSREGPDDPLDRIADSDIEYSISGSVVAIGTGLRVESRLVDNSSGRVLHSVVSEASSPDDLYAVVAELDRGYQQFVEIHTISSRLGERGIEELTRYPVNAIRAYARGREQLSAAQWEPAIRFFREAVSIDSTFVSAWVDLSSCYWNTGDLEAMQASFDRAVALRDRASPRERLWLDLFGSVKDGDGPQIILYAKELLAQEPEHRFVRYLLGKGYFETAQWARAIDVWKPLREQRWSWIWTYLYSSRALSKLGNQAAAQQALDEMDEIVAPTDDHARARLNRYRGLIDLDSGQGEAAYEDFERALGILPTFVELHFDLGRALILSGETERARQEFELYLANPGEGAFVKEARAALAELN